jgi:hypothetical protein
MKPSRYIAGFDSATAFLRALARFLHGKDFPALGTSTLAPPGPRHLVPLVSALPRAMREQLYSWAGWAEAIPTRRLAKVSAEDMADWAVSHYPRRRYPAVALGSSSGALVHLYAALGIPWLPQTFLLPVRHPHPPDDARPVLRFGQQVAPPLLADNPELQLHHQHDAAQDRLMHAHMTSFRVKLRRLGQAFSHFLLDSLEPGGTVLVVECEKRWPTTRVGHRHVFQHGAHRGLEPEEYRHGSPRVEDFLRRHGAPLSRWDAPEPDGDSPEAEWGFEPTLREDVEDLARRKGWRVRRIVFSEPDDPSPLVADLYRWWYQQRRMQVSRLVVESFVDLEPWWVLRTGSVPFWMLFNLESSADALAHYLDDVDPYDFIHLLLFQNGVEGPGMPPVSRWQELLDRSRRWGTFLGVDPEKHPRDFASLVRYHPEFKRLPSRYPMPEPLSLAQLESFLEESGHRYAVHWEDSVTPRAPEGSTPPEEEERGPWLH